MVKDSGNPNFTHPSPVTGSQPGAAKKPVEKQLGLDPLVTSVKTSGWAYCKASVNNSNSIGLIHDSGRRTHQGWVDEAKGALPGRNSLLVDSRQNCSPDRCRQRRATDAAPRALRADNERVTNGRHIGVSTAAYLVDTVADGREVGPWVRVASEVQRD